MSEIVYIKFGKSRSAKLKKAIRLIKGLSGYTEQDGAYSVQISDIREYLINQDAITDAIEIVKSWKSSEVRLLGKVYRSSFDYYEFMDQLKKEAGKYAPILENNGRVSLGAITIESLPLPFVFYPGHYGTFFTFAEDIDGEQYFCECEREALSNYLRLKKMAGNDSLMEHKGQLLRAGLSSSEIQSVSEPEELDKIFRFKEGICFRCNKKIPKKIYCHPMYGGQFKQHYGWYVNQEYYKLGIDKSLWGRMNILPEKCSPELYDTAKRINDLIDRQQSPNENSEAVSELRNGIDRAIENSVREQFGIPKIGDSWVSETMLFNIVKDLYVDQKIIRHYRPDWLEGLELDIYLPDLKLAFEYQGIQHYQAVEHWGGKAQLEIQQEHDRRKKKLCEDLDIRLICIDYDEPLNSEHIESRIKCVI